MLSCTDTGSPTDSSLLQGQRRERLGAGKLSNYAQRTAVRRHQHVVRRNFDGGTAIPAGWPATGLGRVGSDCMGGPPCKSLQFNSARRAINPPVSSGSDQPRLRHLNGDGPALTFKHEVPVESYSGNTTR